MKYLPLPFECLVFIFLIHLTYFSPTHESLTIPFPRLSPTGEETSLKDDAGMVGYDPKDFETHYYNQTLDHFNYMPESYTTFKQRYFISFKYWGGGNTSAPIFAYFGAEAALDIERLTGFPIDNAPSFNALLVYIEHRFYGESVPSGSSSTEEALKKATSLGYFNSAQALADYAEILIYIKMILHAPNSPVIVIGGSYGGMLASWFRLKYPHLALGALASSAPVLYFDDLTPQNCYFSVVTKDFQEASVTCYETILQSWTAITAAASEPNGLSTLSQTFNTCRPLTHVTELAYYLESMYTYAAQYNSPPSYLVNQICDGIDRAPFGNDTLSKIYAGVVARYGNKCTVNQPLASTTGGWSWQRCSEMVMPLGRENETMFPPRPFNLTKFVDDCIATYGVSPRPHWVTTYYGGYDIDLVLRRFGSNIIFSNGLKDPYSCGGVLDSISDTIVAIKTINGSHCLDIGGARKSDPEWLVKQREEIVDIIRTWITQYYADLDGTIMLSPRLRSTI